MSRENLPPQAYTKETLANAITWLQTQPEHVKSLVRSQDSLITIYLKWKRNGAAALDGLSPAYHERLKNDLKSIRAVMDQFDPNAPAPAQTPSTSGSTPSLPPEFANSVNGAPTPISYFSNAPTRSFSAAATAPESTAAFDSLSGSSSAAPFSSDPALSVPSSLAAGSRSAPYAAAILDVESQKRISIVQERLNLSTEAEALRLLISLGFERIRDQLPRI